MLTPQDIVQLERHGLTPDEVARQLELLRDPPPPVRLLRPCTLGDGICRIEDQDETVAENLWRAAAAGGRLSKLVPASGAASRMFAALEAVRAGSPTPEDRAAFDTVRERLDAFGFHRRLETVAGGPRALEQADSARLLSLLLSPEGLDLAAMPKALVPFHRDPLTPTGGRTPLEEHLLESHGYLRDARGRCRVHFTVGARHKAAIKDALAADPNDLLGDEHTLYEVGFSTQAPSTDTVAIDREGRLFRTDSGELLLRPGGHGALLENLNRLDGDVVVIKNIDNVAPKHVQPTVARVLRHLIGHALLLEGRLARANSLLESDSVHATDEALRLLGDVLPSGALREVSRRDHAIKRALALDRVRRPSRVVGVVRNTGEPGGGPFWVRSADGQVSAQIIESAEIDHRDGEQRAIFARATHFNPVLLVCNLRDPDGKAFDLHRFTDPKRVFLAEKSAHGRPLRALEHPGLWNGAMAHWNTVFVEVPDVVFAPVKTVLDLLRPEHQPPANG